MTTMTMTMTQMAAVASRQHFDDSESDGEAGDMDMLTNVSEVSRTLALGGQDTPKVPRKGRRRGRLSLLQF